MSSVAQANVRTAEETKSFVARNKNLILRRISQVSILLLYIGGNYFGWKVPSRKSERFQTFRSDSLFLIPSLFFRCS